MTALKTFISVLLVGLFAFLISGYSMLVEMGTDDTHRETIGVITQLGFPIYYKYWATGMTWARFDGVRFGLNCAVWFAILATIWITVRRLKAR